jgi:hypothetical protein
VVLALDLAERVQLGGLGWPNSRSHAAEPKPITHDNRRSGLRNPIARSRDARSPQNARTQSSGVGAGAGCRFTTRNMAAWISLATTG